MYSLSRVNHTSIAVGIEHSNWILLLRGFFLGLYIYIYIYIKQKLLKCQRTIKIATFNVRTLNRIGQLPELIASAIDQDMDVICMQEHRYIHSEDIKYNDTDNERSLVNASAWKNC